MTTIILDRLLDAQLIKIHHIGEAWTFVNVKTHVGLSSSCWNISLRCQIFVKIISIENYVIKFFFEKGPVAEATDAPQP